MTKSTKPSVAPHNQSAPSDSSRPPSAENSAMDTVPSKTLQHLKNIHNEEIKIHFDFKNKFINIIVGRDPSKKRVLVFAMVVVGR